jgi:uncharacterized protein YbbK (DUF523 family)
MPQPILVSACLLGLLTRYDGQTKRNDQVLKFLRDNDLLPIPVCPEQLAGLPTPRPKTFFLSGSGTQVLDGNGEMAQESGRSMNAAFVRGAMETMKVARLTGCRQALFKEGSPSCGVHRVYREEAIVQGQGVTTALLQRNGLQVFSEEEL